MGVRNEERETAFRRAVRHRLARLPAGAWFSHVTAALLWGIPIPPRARDEPRLHVTVAAPRRAIDSKRVLGHRAALTAGEVTTMADLPVTTPARTWRDLAAMLELPDLVAAGDAILRRRLADEAALLSLGEDGAFRGSRRLRDALELLDGRAESPPESLLRVALIRSGIPPMLVNEPLHDRTGRFVARPDLRLRDWPIVIEYDGDGHRTDQQQWRKDIGRFAAIEDLGETVIRATGDDLPGFERIVARVWDRIARAGGRVDTELRIRGSGRRNSAPNPATRR